MRKWGILVTVFYAVVLVALLTPVTILLTKDRQADFLTVAGDIYSHWLFWTFIALLIGGEALLLFVSVDTSLTRPKPRAHILVSCGVSAVFMGLLTTAGITALAAGIRGDSADKSALFAGGGWPLLLAPWLFWAVVFYLYFRNSSTALTRMMSWLLKGSILELLVAVPCHVVVRRRGDCSAPGATGLGIGTGIAIMLLSFGPGVLLLFKKRFDFYAKAKASSASH